MLEVSDTFKGSRVVFDRINSFYVIGYKLTEKERFFQFQFLVENEAPREFKIELSSSKNAICHSYLKLQK